MRDRFGVVVLISVLVASVSGADDVPACKIAFAGGPSPSGKFMTTTLNVQVGQPKAIRLYAEPSHTLLGIFLDNSDGEPEAPPSFAGLVPGGSSQMIQMALREGAKATVQGPRPQEGDTHIYIHTLYKTAGGGVAEDLFRLATRVSEFSFGLEIFPVAPVAAGTRNGISTDDPPARESP